MDRPAKQPERIDNIKADDAAIDKAFAAYTATDMTGREKQVAAFTERPGRSTAPCGTAEMQAAMAGGLAAYHPAHSDAADASDAAAAALQALMKIEQKSADGPDRRLEHRGLVGPHHRHRAARRRPGRRRRRRPATWPA